MCGCWWCVCCCFPLYFGTPVNDRLPRLALALIMSGAGLPPLDMPRLTPEHWVLMWSAWPYMLNSTRFAFLGMSADHPWLVLSLETIRRLDSSPGGTFFWHSKNVGHWSRVEHTIALSAVRARLDAYNSIFPSSDLSIFEENEL